MSTRTLDRTTFTPTKDPSVWYAGSRTRPGIQYRIERVGHPDMWCACPATKRCAHLNELAELLAAATPAKDDWNDIAPVRASEKEAPLNAPESPTALTVVGRDAHSVIDRDAEMELVAQLRDRAKMAVFKEQIAPDATPAEWDYFLEVAAARRLNPVTGQIHFIVRGKGDNRKATIQTGIDGFRLISQRTNLEDGMDGPYWCGEDGVWRDVWTSKDPPVAAKISVFRKDVPRPYTGIALYEEYVQTKEVWENNKRTGRFEVTSMWKQRPAGQLAKCAESQARRMAFPQDLSGLYTNEEMAQADNPRAAVSAPEVYIEGGTVEEVDDRDPREIWPWLDIYEAERKAAGMKHGGVAEFLSTPIDSLYIAIDHYLKAKNATPKALVSAVADWLAAGKPKDAPEAGAPATDTGTFDEAEWRDPSAEPQEAQG